MSKQIPFIHKLFLGVLTGLFIGILAFFIVNGIVTASNATAVSAQLNTYAMQTALNMTTTQMPLVLPYDPPWAYGLLALTLGFSVPVIGVISMDMNQRENEAADNGKTPSTV